MPLIGMDKRAFEMPVRTLRKSKRGKKSARAVHAGPQKCAFGFSFPAPPSLAARRPHLCLQRVDTLDKPTDAAMKLGKDANIVHML